MRAVAIQAFGRPDGLAVIDVPDPTPDDGQVLLEIEAIGVGGVDALIQRGALAAYGFTEGHILGGEVAGTVTAVGRGVEPSWVGQRVWAFTGLGGGYAEQAVAPMEELVALPAGLSPVDAVTLGSAGAVAHFGLRHADFATGKSVLVRGAAGSLGIMAVQLAARGGASAVAVTTSSTDRGDRLRALGATHVLDRAGVDRAGVDQANEPPAEYDVIFDVAAGPALPSFLDRLDDNGRLVVVGIVAGEPPPDFATGMFAAFQRSRSFGTFSTNTVPVAERSAARADVFAAAVDGELVAVVHDVLPLDQAELAHRRMDAGEVFGRIVLTP